MSTEDPFWAHCYTNHEAFFVHIVGVMGLNLILKHLWMQKIKVQLVLSPAVGVVALRIDLREPFWDEIITLLVDEAVHPGLAHRLSNDLWRKVSYHSSCRRQALAREPFNILYQSGFLVFVELLSRCSPIALRPLTALVSLWQCSSIYTKLISNCPVL
jgi:hypothetical protein